MKTIYLNNGIEIPQMGMGLFQVKDNATSKDILKEAVQMGYRLFDTASLYQNETMLGEVIRESGIKREEFFITSKVWIHSDGYRNTKKSFEESLEKLGLDYLDLYLIHQPFGDYYGAWRAMEELYQQGKIRAIGVSNFSEDRLLDLILNTKIVPAINQVELHPFYQQVGLKKVMRDYGVQVQAWGPLCEGMKNIFQQPILKRIAQKHGKSVAQIVLRWQTQNRHISIPRSLSLSHLKENFEIWDFSLDQVDLNQIQQLDMGYSEIIDHRNLAVVKGLNLCSDNKKRAI
ncbi:TPA: aldo/keto reductase [Streptococcus suis]|uniref:aldo/keto reductase n=1 Tax=Streptococcus suis TaxID=1307 RepID=UPI00209ACA71|nr:aldo/keto reductase [Streptococcus suis]MCO8174368.1 aldo/keto reductase [Streptococcus suis]MCO8208768.1 aldo/keto reductase [Streptococcus suis]HEM3488811.1 aldo/keto reductase [Streptococcus suis]HEM3506797.1 aldo/keto reductase [Streptococcus suis]